ncbi:MAG: hypothetical protein JSV68_20910, partial [Anaerolineaceae bacterium]
MSLRRSNRALLKKQRRQSTRVTLIRYEIHWEGESIVRIEGSHTFNAPRVRVWSILQDPETLQQALPGCEQIDQLSAFDFAAIMHI